MDNSQLPFTNYPYQGRRRLGKVSGSNCRHEYGLRFQQRTGQTHCAYCGLNLVESYENWLTMALDHVVPDSVCRKWGVPNDWKDDYSNRVLCCTACNTFGNRYTPGIEAHPTTLEEFYDLRDKIFAERKAMILERHGQERTFFEQKQWTRIIPIDQLTS